MPLLWVAFDVKEAPAVIAVPDAVSDAIASPSGSAALTVNERATFSWKVAVAGAVTTGARSPPLSTVIWVVAEPASALIAVKVTLKTPLCAFVGVQLNVPDVCEALLVKVAPVGRGAAVRETMASPSGSAAVTVNVRSAFGGGEAVKRAL